MTRYLFPLFLSLSLVQAEPPEWSGNPDQQLTIKTLIGQMRYDLKEIEVEPGARIKLTLDNTDDLQHNLVLLTKGSDASKFAMEMWNLGEAGIEKGWVEADHSQVLVTSKLLNPHEAEDIYFEAPTNIGDYPYVCTVPGHSLLMNGKMKVRQKTRLLHDLKYTYYEGQWSKLPDFSTLKPKSSGELSTGLADLGVAKRKQKFGLVFSGKMILEKAGKYEFALASDDGSRLVIDGEGVVEHDGIHPMGNPRKGDVELQEGEHTFELRYFDGGGNTGLSLMVSGPGLQNVPLSSNVIKAKAKKPVPDPIMLTSENPGEAILYRNFIEGSSPRGIAVGYPGGVNICWDADVMNLAMVWRGGFMDASRHWTNRGQGNQPPAGFDTFKTGQGLPLQVLESEDETWVAKSEGQIAYDRDKPPAERKTMKTFIQRHPDSRFRGYELDEKRFPTFRYEFQDLRVEERFDPSTVEGIESVRRSIVFGGSAKPGTYLRLADTVSGEPADGWYPIGKEAKIKVQGAAVKLRGGSELLAKVTGETTLTVTYTWTQAVGGKVSALTLPVRPIRIEGVAENAATSGKSRFDFKIGYEF
ncbi:MAG: PA14 domain-containing protein [Verrucomicrobiota bacterium]